MFREGTRHGTQWLSAAMPSSRPENWFRPGWAVDVGSLEPFRRCGLTSNRPARPPFHAGACKHGASMSVARLAAWKLVSHYGMELNGDQPRPPRARQEEPLAARTSWRVTLNGE